MNSKDLPEFTTDVLCDPMFVCWFKPHQDFLKTTTWFLKHTADLTTRVNNIDRRRERFYK